MKVALAHDWLNQIGGAEDVLDALLRIYPDSPVYTSIFAKSLMPDRLRERDIQTLWLDRLPAVHRRHQVYLPLYPLAWNNLRIDSYDVILSNKSGFCHGLRFPPRSLHICYCLTPTRYVWQLEHYLVGEELGMAAALLLKPVAASLRRWDFAAAQRVSHFIAISSEVKERIRRYYNRESVVIYPPVETRRFEAAAATAEDYYLVVSRLVPYKRIDLAVRAATELGLKLKIAGVGRDEGRLRSLAGDCVEFLGFVPEPDLPPLMARCRALVFPGLEDFGIAPLQAQASGRPVIAFAGGGALDTVIPGQTGEYFRSQTVDSLKEVWQKLDCQAYNPDVIRCHARKFDTRNFSLRIQAFMEQAWQAHQAQLEFRFRDPVMDV